ncbi:MAG: hypothetical protein SGI92_28220 [Bryobacteraceae bacterium]|nr:hypothetical protein [Bryobacteraceae bacterium]
MKFVAFLIASASLLPAQVFVSGQGARAVIGQTSFTRQVPGASEKQLGSVGGIAIANDTLFVVDSSRVFASPQNHRVLVFPNISQQLPEPKSSRPWSTGDVRCPVCGGTASTVLGQTDFTSTSIGLAQDKFRTPTAVASDGRVLAVADTDNNRVLVWLTLPSRNGQPADVVIGQPDFKTNGINFGGGGQTPSAKGLRSPQGLLIQDGKLYIADTQNNRVVIFNSMPRANGASADLVLGAPNLNTSVQQDLVAASLTFKATPKNMVSPVGVTSDGKRLIVTDLGHNRVLIWNSIPNANEAPADVVVGQPDITSSDDNLAYLANNSTKLCPSNGTNANGNVTYPFLCAATLNFPRHAISDGKRLYIADGGNDRVLIYNDIPTTNGKAADIILGQLTENLVQDSDPEKISAADTFRTPTTLSWDGTNLYVSDPFNRRVVVYTPADLPLPVTGVRNAASRDIFALTAVTFVTAPKENDEITLKLAGDKEYKYKAVKDDTIEVIIRNLVTSINAGAGDPKVLATSNPLANQFVLTSRVGGAPGNDIAYAITFSENAQLSVSTASGNLAGGQDAAKIAPGTIISILGEQLSDTTVSADATKVLPQTLGNVEVYIDGIRAPLLMVSPGEIRSQMPWEVSDSSSVSVYVRRVDSGNRVLTTTAIGVPIIPQNPGIFAVEGLPDPRPALAYHASSQAIGVVSVDGAVKAGDTATVTIEDRPYTYTVKEGDTLNIIRDSLVNLINGDEKVMAEPSTLYTRILLKARIPGPEGDGIAYSAKAVDGANVIMTALSPALCCSAREGSPITNQEPARPGELIYVITTGLGFVKGEGLGGQVTGGPYHGPADNSTSSPVDDAQVGGKTANVLSARLIPGLVGVYQVRLQLNSDIPTNPQTQMWIAQLGYISNIVSIPVVNPVAPFPQ